MLTFMLTYWRQWHAISCKCFVTKLQESIIIEYGSGSNKKGCWLKDFILNEANSNALLRLHAFTGNDFVSSFFRKGKLNCWKILQKCSKFEDCFSQLGAEGDSLLDELEEYVCSYLYGYNKKHIKKVQWLLFQKKHVKENKVIVDLSALPPCCNVLRIYSERANFIAKKWRSSLKNQNWWGEFQKSWLGWIWWHLVDWPSISWGY